ncbi:MAG TPA: hypothetical protein VMC43_03695, partial [Candidatus Paceibacterota bacterium]|nr:hypothetical protein [Candidatus Paceibacterota bacterium]
MNPNPFNFKLAKWGILTGVINMNVIGLMFRFPTESIFDWGHTLIAFLPGIILGVTLLCAGLPIDRRTKISFNRKLGFVAFASASFNIAFHTGWAIMGAKVFSEELHGDIHGYLPTFFGITFGMAMAGLIGAIVLLIGFH